MLHSTVSSSDVRIPESLMLRWHLSLGFELSEIAFMKTNFKNSEDILLILNTTNTFHEKMIQKKLTERIDMDMSQTGSPKKIYQHMKNSTSVDLLLW